MSNDTDRVPLIFQSALVSAPLMFIGLPAWILVVILQLFDIDILMEVVIVMACVLPIALWIFASVCRRYGLIHASASPVAIAIFQSAAAAFGIWLYPQLPSHWRSSVGLGGRQGGSLAAVLMTAMIFVAGWLALVIFSGKSADVDPKPPEPPPPPPDPLADGGRRLPL
jgi:hypothetical protein